MRQEDCDLFIGHCTRAKPWQFQTLNSANQMPDHYGEARLWPNSTGY